MPNRPSRTPLEAMGRDMEMSSIRGWKTYMANAYFFPPRAKNFEPRIRAIHEEGLSATAINAALVTAMSWRPTIEPTEVVRLRPCHIQMPRIADSGRSDLRNVPESG